LACAPSHPAQHHQRGPLAADQGALYRAAPTARAERQDAKPNVPRQRHADGGLPFSLLDGIAAVAVLEPAPWVLLAAGSILICVATRRMASRARR